MKLSDDYQRRDHGLVEAYLFCFSLTCFSLLFLQMKFKMITLSIALLLISFTGANASGIGSSCSKKSDCDSGLYCYNGGGVWASDCTSCTNTLYPCSAYNSIDDLCCSGIATGEYDSTVDFFNTNSESSCCDQLDCGALQKCESASAFGITACACNTDTGKVAGLAVGIILFFIATIVAICWCCKCCCFKKPAQVVVVQAPQATVAQA